MPDFELKASDRHLTSHTGLALIGQCCEVAEVNRLAAAFPMTGEDPYYRYGKE
jgi:hypothetical protein